MPAVVGTRVKLSAYGGVRALGAVRVGILGGYTGWVIPGYYRHARSSTRKVLPPAERAPEPLQGVEWVGGRAVPAGPSGAPAHPLPTPPGPGRSLQALPGRGWAPRAKGRDSTSFLGNLVKTAKCHQKVLKRPLIVPILKTGSEYHLLNFSDFHIW